ncbi:MAG: ParB/RepB/Spo0J family partition protein, partial [Spirochaetota bacterium]|nr:ParB/RepB/Spo0J family partition protein [Spirochaetota bacterium]
MTYQHTEIPLSDIKLLRPERQYTDGESLQELADSIKSLGLLQPVLVRYSGDGYELIAGERRLKAFQLLSDSHPGEFQSIPVRIFDSEQNPAVLSLVENIQRLPLTALEESNSLYELIRITSKGYADLGK